MMRKIVLLVLVILPAIFTFLQCSHDSDNNNDLTIISSSVSDLNSPFYLSTDTYKSKHKELPIGVFDSGTGGLAVLEAILTLDEFNNTTNIPGSDGIPDFISESFIYLADEANMPYGRYDAEGKAEFLRELVVKDVIFLAGTKYYMSPDDKTPQTNKLPVKEIVIACNTATAYGLETVKDAAQIWGLPVKITGIIEAGAKDAIRVVKDGDIKEPLIAVFATEGTCSSGGYPKTIIGQAGEYLPDINIKVVQQAGIGLAGAIDGDINYIDPIAARARSADKYFGPDIGTKDYPLDIRLWEDYNFAGENELFIKTGPEGDTSIVQLNSVRNYVRYMVTSLVKNVSENYPDRSIDIAILGCTHYPYEENEIRNHFKYLKNKPEYKNIIPDSIIFIDPSISLASTLYTNLVSSDLLANNSINKSEFYISVPNTLLKENIIDENMEFPYNWKYGRNINSGLQYVKIVPFSEQWIGAEIRERIKVNLPATYNIMK